MSIWTGKAPMGPFGSMERQSQLADVLIYDKVADDSSARPGWRIVNFLCENPVSRQ
jgi:hypothetical protein